MYAISKNGFEHGKSEKVSMRTLPRAFFAFLILGLNSWNILITNITIGQIWLYLCIQISSKVKFVYLFIYLKFLDL